MVDLNIWLVFCIQSTGQVAWLWRPFAPVQGHLLQVREKGLACLFPHHSLLTGRDDKWWLDTLDRFTRDAERTAQKDHAHYKDIKSSALYRDTSKELPMDDLNSMNSPEAMYRTQYRGKYHVTISYMFMVKR